jgi:hypothetical protein
VSTSIRPGQDFPTTRAQTPQPDGEAGLLGLPSGDQRLLALIAAAAPFADRAAGEFFSPAKGARRAVAERSARWLAAAVGTGPGAAAATTALLRHRERTGRDLGAGLVDVVVTDPAKLPDWAYALVEFLLAQPLTDDADPASGYVGAPLMAFRRAANRLIDLRNGRLRGVRITPDGKDDIAGQLIERLTTACDAALAFEFDLAAGPDKPPGQTWARYDRFDVSRTGWLERLESLPALAHLIGVTCLQWRAVIRELFDRLHADLPDLRRALWQWRDPGPLVSYSGDSGDLHDHGRVVSLLTFESGERVVYKPKNLDTVVAFNDLLTFLNTHGAPAPVHTRIALGKGAYGWEEYVRSNDCAEPGEFGGYYFELGELARIVQLLRARDFWADNLIAVGAHPVFIDLECLLQSRPGGPASTAVRGDELWRHLEEGLSPTAVVSMARPLAAGRQYQDIGCMAALEEQLTADSTGFPPGWEAPRYRPRTQDAIADPRQFHDEFLAGYEAMSRFLAGHAEALSDERGPLGLLRNAPVRYVWRNTFDCTSIMRGSLTPAALSSGVAREMVLARTLRGFVPLVTADGGSPDDVLEIIEQEIDSFRRGDVPLFLAKTASTAVYTPEGTRIPDHFPAFAWDGLLDRLRRLTESDVETDLTADLDVAKAMLWISDGQAEQWPLGDTEDGQVKVERVLGVPVYKPSDLRTEVSEDELLNSAGALGDAMLGAARELSAGRLGWTGLVQYPAHGMPALEPLHGDLLSGTGGVGVFLAELYRNTGRPAYWTAARQAFEATLEYAEHATTAAHRWLSGPGAAVGGFVGLGGACYALARGADALGEPGLARTAAELAGRSGPDPRQPMAADLIAGAAGQLLGFRALRKTTTVPDSPEWTAWTEVLTERLRRQLNAGPDTSCHPYPVSWSPAGLVPSGWAGVRYTAAVLAADGVVLDGGQAWPIGGDGPLTIPEAYALAGAAAIADAPAPENVLAALRTWGADTRAHPSAELLAIGELAWEVAVAFDLDEFRPLAHRCARALLARKERYGSYFPERGAPDSLMFSAVNGTAAAGLFLLRLCDEEMPSLRLLSVKGHQC